MNDAEELIRLINMEGKTVTYSQPGEIVCDLDGLPIGIDPGKSGTATLGRVTLTSEQWESIARYLINERKER